MADENPNITWMLELSSPGTFDPREWVGGPYVHTYTEMDIIKGNTLVSEQPYLYEAAY